MSTSAWRPRFPASMPAATVHSTMTVSYTHLALDTYVELYHGGIVPLEEFAKRPVRRDDRDILVRIIIKKDGRKAVSYTHLK